MTILLTGVAGFIGSHVAAALLSRGEAVLGIDNLNAYYDVGLKRARLARLQASGGFAFREADISDRALIAPLAAHRPAITRIVHLAAQAGVRHSMRDPFAYVTANVMGQVVLLELARGLPGLRHFVYASSSSVYGLNETLPFDEADRVDRPASVYAATKRAGELLSHAYTHLFDLPQTGLRFFTVYGPWGRPDMAYYAFARAIMSGEPITLFGDGALSRDFTYVDDVVDRVVALLDRPPGAGEPARLVNIGNHRPERVDRLVTLLEQGLGRSAIIRNAPAPLADVRETCAAQERIEQLIGRGHHTSLEVGVSRFCAWFRKYHGPDGAATGDGGTQLRRD